jgi:hypothetical protein
VVNSTSVAVRLGSEIRGSEVCRLKSEVAQIGRRGHQDAQG